MDDQSQDSVSFAFNGKIMISSIALLVVACFIVVSFHAYARWFRRRPIRRHRLNTSTTILITSDQGLDLHVMNSLPTFIYESKSHDQESPLECAVCLSDFEDAETGRVLPECKHCFHVDCIDMWLQSHRDCPLCRAQVKLQPVHNPARPVPNSDERMVLTCVLEDAGSGSGHGLDPALETDGVPMGCSSSSPMLAVLEQSTSPTEHDPTKKEGALNLDGSDIESGPKTTVSSVKGLKRLFSI